MTFRSMSRRAFLPLITGAALSPVVLVPQSARAQGAAWQIYRRDDLGFEIEMPGRPEIREDRIDGQVSIEVAVDVDRMRFGIGYEEYGEAITIEEFAAAQRLVARTHGSTVVRETAITMNGLPGLDVIVEFEPAVDGYAGRPHPRAQAVYLGDGQRRWPSFRRRVGPPVHQFLQAAAITGDRVMTMKLMSRRAFLPLIAGAALSPAVLVPRSARAQGANWQMYRPDLGFEAEMPGEPKIKIEKGERDDVIVRTVDAEVDVDATMFGANFQEYRIPLSMREELLGQQMFARGLEGRVARMSRSRWTASRGANTPSS